MCELVEETEVQPSPPVNTAPKVAFLDQPEILGETRSSLELGSGVSSEKDSTRVLGLSDSVGGSGADFDVSTKSGGTDSGVSSLSSTKSSSSDISQPRSSDVSCKETTNSSPSLDSTPREKNLSFCEQDPISNGESDSSKFLKIN